MPKQFAINVIDLTNDQLISQILVGPVVPNKIMVEVEKGMDGLAVVLETDDQRAAAICWALWRKHSPTKIRCYYGEGEEWQRMDEESIKPFLSEAGK